MTSFFDRLNEELEILGKRAQSAFDAGRLRLELLRVQRERDGAARDLGLLVHRRERGESVDQLEVDSLLVKLDGLAQDLARIEREIASAKGEAVSVGETPPPAPAQPAEVEEVREAESR